MTRTLTFAAVFVALALAGCGRAGSPERPPNTQNIPLAPVDPTEPQDREAPDRKFVLDPLLQ